MSMMVMCNANSIMQVAYKKIRPL